MIQSVLGFDFPTSPNKNVIHNINLQQTKQLIVKTIDIYGKN